MIEVKLDEKPIPVPLSYQPIYKIVLLLAILKYCCDKPYKATFLKLHLFMWALRSDSNYKVLSEIADGKRNTIAPWTFEPGLERVVTLSIVAKYCTKELLSSELQIRLSEEGIRLLANVEREGYFRSDIARIKAIGKVPQNRLAAANKNWSIQ